MYMLIVRYIDARIKTVYLHNSWHPTERDPQSRPHLYTYLTLGYGSRQHIAPEAAGRNVECEQVHIWSCDWYHDSRDM